MERKVKPGSSEKNLVMVQFDLVGFVSIYRFGPTLGLCLLGFPLRIAGLTFKKEDAPDQVKVTQRWADFRFSLFFTKRYSLLFYPRFF
jgi:hypothetical protein